MKFVLQPICSEKKSNWISMPVSVVNLKENFDVIGHDGITSWILKEYADILPPSITTILNSSFVEQRCPSEDG